MATYSVCINIYDSFLKANSDCQLVKENYMAKAGLTECDLPHGLKTKADLCTNLPMGKMSEYRRINTRSGEGICRYIGLQQGRCSLGLSRWPYVIMTPSGFASWYFIWCLYQLSSPYFEHGGGGLRFCTQTIEAWTEGIIKKTYTLFNLRWWACAEMMSQIGLHPYWTATDSYSMCYSRIFKRVSGRPPFYCRMFVHNTNHRTVQMSRIDEMSL